MNTRAIHLYKMMQTDLSLCRNRGKRPLKEIECCFQVVERYWAILKDDLRNHIFISPAEEIEFFKKTKPLFVSEAEYYSLRYHAQLFTHDSKADERQKFWEREFQRLPRFIQEQQDFYDRYKGDCTENDRKWYLRNDPEDMTASSHDFLVATLMALERYQEYIKQELGSEK